MNLQTSTRISARRRSQASVLIIVMWIALGLVAIALYFANSMTYELRASDNRVAGLQADQAIEGAARYVSAVLTTYATNGAVPDSSEFASADVPVGDAHFWLIGRDPDAGLSGTTPTEPSFGLVDEGSKLNLNIANTNMLAYLPNMTADFAEAILDWRGTNGMVDLNYAALDYYPKNATFETEDELRLVYGATVDLLAGDDLNRNGVLDPNEQGSAGTGQITYGLFEYTTVWTREPNFHSDGSTLTNVNSFQGAGDWQTFLQNEGVGNATGVAQSLFQDISGSGGGGGANPCNGIVDFAHRCWQFGMTETDFGKICNDVTTTTNAYIRGRVNVNTASADVLTALFEGLGVDDQTASGAAQSLVTYRGQNSGNLASVWWLMDALGNNSPVITALARGDYVTTKSFQFTADIAALGQFGRGYRRVKFVFDTSNGTPTIIYRQDLSRLGWALGDQTRQALLAQESQ